MLITETRYRQCTSDTLTLFRESPPVCVSAGWLMGNGVGCCRRPILRSILEDPRRNVQPQAWRWPMRSWCAHRSGLPPTPLQRPPELAESGPWDLGGPLAPIALACESAAAWVQLVLLNSMSFYDTEVNLARAFRRAQTCPAKRAVHKNRGCDHATGQASFEAETHNQSRRREGARCRRTGSFAGG
jgi:hypothetical protein